MFKTEVTVTKETPVDDWAQIHDPNVDDPNGYQHRFAEVNGIRIHSVEEKGGAR